MFTCWHAMGRKISCSRCCRRAWDHGLHQCFCPCKPCDLTLTLEILSTLWFMRGHEERCELWMSCSSWCRGCFYPEMAKKLPRMLSGYISWAFCHRRPPWKNMNKQDADALICSNAPPRYLHQRLLQEWPVPRSTGNCCCLMLERNIHHLWPFLATDMFVARFHIWS